MGSTRCSVQRVDRECNLIEINKMDWVYALGLAASGLMQLRHIDFRLTVTAQIVELNPFHVCTTHSQCSVIFSTELLFCKKQFFFPVDNDGPTAYVFFFSPG